MLKLSFSLQVVAMYVHNVLKIFFFVCCVLIINDGCLVQYVLRWTLLHPYTLAKQKNKNSRVS